MRPAVALILVSLSAAAAAQPSFEVASIKPHPGVIAFSSDPSPHGNRVTAVASTLIDMITAAYNLRYEQITGAPGWARSDHFDLEAKAGETAITRDQMRPMLQTLLADRFHLRVHRETKEVLVYALVVAKTGAKLQPSAETDAPQSRITVGPDAIIHRTVTQGTMAELAGRLSSNGAGRPVIDQSGLTGRYGYKLDWMNGTPGPESDTGPLLDALPRQLGLKLEPSRGAIPILVIDHAEKPSPN